MAYLPKMSHTGEVVALIAAVLDARDGAPGEAAKAAGRRMGMVMADDPGEFVSTSAFIAAALAELAAEAIGTSPEEVLATILTAGSVGADQEIGSEDVGSEYDPDEDLD